MLSIIALLRYLKKRSAVALTLAIALVFFAIAMIFQVTGQILTNDNINFMDYLWSSGNPSWGAQWLGLLIAQFQIADFFLVLGLYMLAVLHCC